MQKNYKSMIEQNGILCNTSNQQSGMSPANKVISNLTSREDVSVVYLVTKVELGEHMYTKSKKKKKTLKPQWELHITFKLNVVNNGGETLTWPATLQNLWLHPRMMEALLTLQRTQPEQSTIHWV
jgi:hypothetical protein